MKNDNNAYSPRRRQLIAATGALGALALTGSPWPALAARAPLTVGALFAGRIDDGGFMEAGYRGLERARSEFGVKTRHIDDIPPEHDKLAAALRELAAGSALVIAHGGQNNEAARQVAAEFPKVRFVVTQGAVTSANLASYDVLQEQSAFLAGALAALHTRSNVVGHMSGIRVKPGLKGRAAYVAGVHAINPKIRVLTNFSGNQDDNALSKRVAEAQIAAGADVIFTMLNAGRGGVGEACRAHGIKQIGNVVDWVKRDPEVFVASAIADVGIGVYNAVRDQREGKLRVGEIRKIGLDDAAAVRLSLHPDVPGRFASRLADLTEGVRSGRIHVPEDYDGPEFNV
ncbi:BMP family ABC transporter substrate-binding protein [Azoarcus sp. DD4]|uniref:BMP family protein n=1 Tax=Azoarcus sp. DD4 TaxID=2027405 RepID=UPI001128DDD1|nr:BMP family protein [Azoarcus sp. DD4]QDF96328.1 BMP family ABC transporter substrate-binding protein [Azoarcus sp. DD4]